MQHWQHITQREAIICMTPMKWRNSAKSMHQVYLIKSTVPSSTTWEKSLQKKERNCNESEQWQYCTVLVFIEIRYSPSFGNSIKNKQHSFNSDKWHYFIFQVTSAKCSLGIGDWRILQLLTRISLTPWKSSALSSHSFIIILLLLYTILLLLQFWIKTLLQQL